MQQFPKFSYNGKNLIILPGSKFTRNELLSRIHQMDIQFDNSSQSKPYLVDIYENSLKYNQNKLKIIDKLEKDTIYFNKRNNILTDNINNLNNTINNNIPQTSINTNLTRNNNTQNKVMRIEITPINRNINIKTNYNNTRQENYNYNPPMNNINNINNNYNDNFQKRENNNYNNMNKNKNYSLIDAVRNEIKNYQNNPNYNNDINTNNNEYSYNKNLYPYQSNNNQINSYPNNQINNLSNEQNKEKLQRKNCLIYNNESEDSEIQPFEPGKKPIIQNYNNSNYNNNNNYNNNQFSINNNNFSNNSTELSRNPINNINNNSNYNSSILDIRDNNNSYNNNNEFRNRMYEDNYNNNNRIIEEDEQSVSSNFSTALSTFKSCLPKKVNLGDCFDVLIKMLIAFLIIIVVINAYHYCKSFELKVKEVGKTIANPKKLFVNLLWGLIKSLIIGICWKYLYITLPLVVISYLIYKAKKKYEFKKLCKKIIEEIKQELKNAEKNSLGYRSINERDLVSRYSQRYGIDYGEFNRRYLPELLKLRKKDPALKLSQTTDKSGKIITSWEMSMDH